MSPFACQRGRALSCLSFARFAQLLRSWLSPYGRLRQFACGFVSLGRLADSAVAKIFLLRRLVASALRLGGGLPFFSPGHP